MQAPSHSDSPHAEHFGVGTVDDNRHHPDGFIVAYPIRLLKLRVEDILLALTLAGDMTCICLRAVTQNTAKRISYSKYFSRSHARG
jgi:hypothetical protein